MAKKRRGPGRPPKRRGPGRPPGSKNKPKREVAISTRTLNEIDRRLQDLPTSNDVQLLARDVRHFAELGDTRWNRLVNVSMQVEQLEDKVRRMTDDAEHPTTQVLARRLLALEAAEKISKSTHDRITTIEVELRSLRSEFGDMIAERHAERNRAEVKRIAEQGDGGQEHGSRE